MQIKLFQLFLLFFIIVSHIRAVLYITVYRIRFKNFIPENIKYFPPFSASFSHYSLSSLLFSFRFSLSIYIFPSSVLLEGNYNAVTQNQIEEMCEASLMFSRAPKTGASRRLSRV